MYPPLIVCWKKPDLSLLNQNQILLSFLEPIQEHELRKEFGGSVISARDVAPKIKNKAVSLYVDMVADIGIYKYEGETSIRQYLKIDKDVSSWWFHPVSFKYCESDKTFDYIVSVLIVDWVAQENNFKGIETHGVPKEIALVLKSKYLLNEVSPGVVNFSWGDIFIKPIFQRFKWVVQSFVHLFYIKKYLTKAKKKLSGIFFCAFWDWSIKEGKDNRLEEKYFGSVPLILSREQHNIGWLGWFDPFYESHKIKKSIKECLKSAAGQEQLILVQIYLYYVDIISALFDFKAFFCFISLRGQERFRSLFCREELNYFYLFYPVLLAGSLDYSIPKNVLVYRAYQRAFNSVEVSAWVNFLEFFPHARASNAAARSLGVPVFDVQHASYSREKTYGIYDKKKEYSGSCCEFPIPQPDYICAMGLIGRKFFTDNGHDPQKVFLTGSPRYDRIAGMRVYSPREISSKFNFLIIPALDPTIDLEMIAIVYEICKDSDVQLRLRSHPFLNYRHVLDFKKYTQRISLSTNQSLQADFDWCSVVICSYSTVGEEAFIEGIPVWQWRPWRQNGSALRDLKDIPKFYSVESFKNIFEEYKHNPEVFIPSFQARQEVKEQCFMLGEERPSEAVGKVLLDKITCMDKVKPA